MMYTGARWIACQLYAKALRNSRKALIGGKATVKSSNKATDHSNGNHQMTDTTGTVTSQGDTRIEVIYDPPAIARRLDELATEIAGRGFDNLIAVAVLKGSFVFAADLLRALHRVGIAPEVDFLTLSSYRKSTISSGSVDILRDIELEVRGRDVLLIDDVLDSGRTLAFAKDLLAARGAAVTTCLLLVKNTDRTVQISADFHAFDCDERHYVGYGLGLANKFRSLPFIGRLAE